MRTLRRSLGVLLVIFIAGCGSDAVGPAAIIILTNTWTEEGNDQHRFNIQDDTGFQAKESGTFTGTEQLANGTQYTLSGSWRNSSVTMEINRSPKQVWTARITESNANRLVFERSGSKLVLVR